MGEARGYFVQQLRRSWGLTAVRAFARHRLRRVHFVGGERRPRAVQARGAAEGEWAHGDAGRFQAWAARATGASGPVCEALVAGAWLSGLGGPCMWRARGTF